MNHFSTWPEVKNVEIAFLPIGSLEQHGYHLPIAADSIIAEAIAHECAKRFDHSFVCPVLPYSASFEHAGFPGSISLQSITIIMVVKDIIRSLERMGVDKIVMINGHGGNYLLGNIAQEMNVDHSRILLAPSRKHWEKAYEQAGISAAPSRDMHAGEGETSILMYLDEALVRMEQRVDVDSPERDLLTACGIKPYTETGAIGFPTRASADKGRILLQALGEQISMTVRKFMEGT
ncbi:MULTISPECIES: creatininase family protein [unclassified Thermoactinomyces]|jgi:creatinine amidohydrolase|uniref:creatininase family protein n=1 Tax=unclassified Thermoactinomyces TaxID=2634588 RepID=UPI0018DD1155|nr:MULTISPECIES: creatininase family protein [unclassified Thermoactinomyces]MBH8599016.1 creatininase family protein [Thermoactinomyces sp. CICC 10523]MBH8605003.1 creatininase family protein [Thermoactinomyces sp. CICC 10522]MBH8608443.1 creatininase family protein [Thermoactinomyces sp. CICC 10521]